MLFTFIDIETTAVPGVLVGGHRWGTPGIVGHHVSGYIVIPEQVGIVQVGIHVVNELFDVIETESWNFQPFPSDMVDQKALEKNGLTEDQIVEWVSPLEAHSSMVDFLGGCMDKYNPADKAWFAGYNVQSFDYPLLRSWFNKCGDKFFGSWWWYPPLDVMNMAALLFLDTRVKLENFQLATVAREMGVSVDESMLHDADYDINITVQLFKMIVKTMNWKL